MPGLRHVPVGMNSCTSSTLGRGDREAMRPAASRGPYLSGMVLRGREVAARPRNVPHVANNNNQFVKVRRAPQWLQQSTVREDSRVGYLGATPKCWDSAASSVVPDPTSSYNGDNVDLQAMVHDFIENDCADCVDGVDRGGRRGAPSLTLSDNVQMLIKPHSAQERELLADVQRLLLTANENTDLMCDNDNSTDCKGACIKRFVVKHLKLASYNASVCKSKWLSSGRVPGGEYEYIDVAAALEQAGGERTNLRSSSERLIVDINFQTQFEIARPTPQYATGLKSLPTVFVGTTSKLEQVLRLMSEAAKVSLEQSDMHLPPWRTLGYMRSKWLSKFDRLIKSTSSVSLRSWRATSTPSSRRSICVDELRRTKLALLVETKSTSNSLLCNLPPRSRTKSRANLLQLQSAAP